MKEQKRNTASLAATVGLKTPVCALARKSSEFSTSPFLEEEQYKPFEKNHLLKTVANFGKGLIVATILIGFTAGVSRAAEPVIGILPKTIIGDVFMKNMSDAAVAKGKALGAKVEVYSLSSHEAVEEQVSAVESLISRKVDAIILAAVDSKRLAPVVDKATAAGIPVILADSGVKGANYFTVVQNDNIAASNLAAYYTADLR